MNIRTYNDSSWKNLTNAMTGFLRDVKISSGTLELDQTSPGHHTLRHLTQTTSPSLNDSDIVVEWLDVCKGFAKNYKNINYYWY